MTKQDWKALPNITYHDPAALMILQNAYVHVKVAFVSPETVVFYWVRGPAGEVRIEEPLLMEAVFLDSQTGALRHREKWPVRKRHESGDAWDTEARILAVEGGRFVVHAHGRILLYSPDFKLLRERELGSNLGDTWAVHVPIGGRRLFVRDEFRGGVHYSWLDVDTLAEVYPDPAPPTGGEAVHVEVLPADGGYYLANDKKLTPYPAGQDATIPCDWPGCFGAWPLAGGHVVLQSQRAVFLYARDGRAIWSRQTRAQVVSFAAARSLDGESFLVQWNAGHGDFDGISLSGDRFTVFVYDLATQKRTLMVPIPAAWEVAYALAPDGSRLVALRGTTLQVFQCAKP